MKVLTLWQPHASLVALGVKTIETRSWSTKYRGPLAIHAASKRPPYVVGHVGLAGPVGGDDPHWAMDLRDGRRIRLPLGAIVATCTLVDVVPIVGPSSNQSMPWCADTYEATDGKGHLYLARTGYPLTIIDDQRPYGDFTPGRFAYLLADIVPVDPPVPFKGGQGLTKTWEPA